MVQKRLELVLVLALALVAAPLSASAQPRASVFRIGYLGPSTPALETHLVEVFRQELRGLGYMEGENLTITYRWAEGRDDRLPTLAAELVRLGPDVLVTTGTPGTLAARQATNTVPIVTTSSGDPVKAGLAATLARPGGNITGFSIMGPDLEGKRLELLKQIVPRLLRVGVLWNAANRGAQAIFEQTLATAPTLGLTLQPVAVVRRIDEFESAFGTIARVRPQALVVIGDRFLLAHRMRITSFAAEQRLPAVYPYREYVDAGGLLSYAPSNIELFRGAAVYVDKILKGAKAGDLPIQQPSRFELVINLKAAKSLGLAIPPSLLAQADHLVQ